MNNPLKPAYQLLWAKTDPYHELWRHLLDVAAVCEALLPRFGGVPPLPDAWTIYLAGLHDLGKADSVFQNKDADQGQILRDLGFIFNAPNQKFRHEARSAEWVFSHLRSLNWSRSAAFTIDRSIRGHHGDFRTEVVYSEDDYQAQNAQWHPLREEIAVLLRNVLRVSEFVLEEFEDASAAGVKLSGLIVLSDWIASNEEIYRYPILDENFSRMSDASPQQYFLIAQDEAKNALRRVALQAPIAIADDTPLEFSSLFSGLDELRPSQIALQKLCNAGLAPGLIIIEAPMGEGKTEGALFVAEHWRRRHGRIGAYLGLPTMATSNQMHGRYQDFIRRTHPEQENPRLIHGMAWLIDEETPSEEPQIGDGGYESREDAADALDWFRNAKRALIAPEGVGTVDQAMRAALNVKHGFLRLFGLINRVLIVDECHAYDEFMTTILEKLLEWCRALEIPIILLSATLSRRQKERLVSAYGAVLPPLANTDEYEGYPLITSAPMQAKTAEVHPVISSSPLRTTLVRRHYGLLGDSEATARLALDTVGAEGCLCLLVNTVREAQEVYQELQEMTERFPEKPELMLFHSRFRAEVRQQIEKKVIQYFGKGPDAKRPNCAILVATQVVEQSLDVDFDVFISALAPIDLLLQRSGRLHRHPKKRPDRHSEPVLHILLNSLENVSSFGGTGQVYQREQLFRTLALLENRNEFVLPRDFRPLVEGCYSDAPIQTPVVTSEIIKEAKRKREDKEAKDRSKAREGLLPSPSVDDFTIADAPDPKREGEDGEASYFIAQTRLSDDSITALVLNRSEQVRQAKAAHPPQREKLKALFLQKVGIPGYWLERFKSAEGYEPLDKGEKWLRGHQILALRNGEWRGVDDEGHTVVIVDDPKLGLTCTKGGQLD